MAWRIERVESVKSLVDTLFGLHRTKNFYFRGEPAKWPFSKSLFDRKMRLSGIREINWTLADLHLCDEFERLVRQHPSQGDHSAMFRRSASLLPLMQHLGVPTRFLDWTGSPWVAAFWAAQPGSVSPSGALDSRGPSGTPELEADKAVIYAMQWAIPYSNDKDSVRSQKQDALLRQIRDDCDLSHAIPCPSDPPVIVLLKGMDENPRAIAQQSMHTYSSHFDMCHRQLIDEALDVKVAIEFPAAMKPELLRLLSSMNVCFRTLFPDREGVGREVAQVFDSGDWPEGIRPSRR